MPMSKKSAKPRRVHRAHSLRRHGAVPAHASRRSHEVAIIALEAAGWRVVGIRVDAAGGPTLWRVTIERFDESVTMTATEADLDVTLETLGRYVAVDAQGR